MLRAVLSTEIDGCKRKKANVFLTAALFQQEIPQSSSTFVWKLYTRYFFRILLYITC